MNKLTLALAAFLGLTLLAPSSAEAGGCRTRVTYDNCGTCISWEYRCVGRDYHGCPLYRWVAVSRSYPRYSGYAGGYYVGGYSRGHVHYRSGGYYSSGHGRYHGGHGRRCR